MNLGGIKGSGAALWWSSCGYIIFNRFNFWTCLNLNLLKLIKALDILGYSHILFDIMGLDILGLDILGRTHKDIWKASTEEQLLCQHENGNCTDPFAVEVTLGSPALNEK